MPPCCTIRKSLYCRCCTALCCTLRLRSSPCCAHRRSRLALDLAFDLALVRFPLCLAPSRPVCTNTSTSTRVSIQNVSAFTPHPAPGYRFVVLCTRPIDRATPDPAPPPTHEIPRFMNREIHERMNARMFSYTAPAGLPSRSPDPHPVRPTYPRARPARAAGTATTFDVEAVEY